MVINFNKISYKAVTSELAITVLLIFLAKLFTPFAMYKIDTLFARSLDTFSYKVLNSRTREVLQ